MKLQYSIGLSTAVAICSPALATASPWSGEYEAAPGTSYAFVKWLTIKDGEKGTFKVNGSIVGFPYRTSSKAPLPVLLESTKATSSRDYNTRNSQDTLITSYPTNKYRVLLIVRRGPPYYATKKFKFITYTCYLTLKNGEQVHIDGKLYRSDKMPR